MSDCQVMKMFGPIHFVAGFYVGKNVSLAYKFYCNLIDSIVFIILLGTAYQISPSTKKESLAVSMIVCIAHVSVLYHSLCFRLQTLKILKLMSLFETAVFYVSGIITNGNEIKNIHSSLTHDKNTLCFGILAALMPAFLFSIQPLLRSMAVFGMDGSKELQIDVWCPFDLQIPVVFEMMVGLEFFTVFWVCIRFFATDSFYRSFFTLNIKLFQRLAIYGKNVISLKNNKNDKCNKSNKDIFKLNLLQQSPHPNELDIKETSHEDYLLPFDQITYNEIEKKLRVFITHHQLILRCAKKTCELYSPVMLIYLLGLLGFASFGSFGVFHTKGLRGVQPISVLLFSIANLLCMYLMCAAGDDLAQKSSEVAVSLVSSPWYVCSKKFRSSLVLVLQRVNARVEASVIGVPSIPLASSTFLWFLKTLITFYLFLVQVQANK